jgi:glucokinase
LEKSLLVGDIGGTNARFAFAKTGMPGIEYEKTYQCAEFSGLVEAIQSFLDQPRLPSPEAICLAVAGPVVDGKVNFTNNPWTISVSELQKAFGMCSICLLNDFEAIAYSLPVISIDDLLPIGGQQPRPLDSSQFTVAAIGPGTGLGAVGLRKQDHHCFPIVGEASHSGFAPETREQTEILEALRGRFERVSNERLVSGPGLENLYWGLAQVHDEYFLQLSAPDILLASVDGNNYLAVKAVELFYEILGQVAGDLALALGANDGIYIAGGITQRYPLQLVNSRFRSGFENKGRHRQLMRGIPTQLILHKQPGLLGALNYANKVASAE